jgi:ribosomal protein S18 acetylase RimI-like enzyme
MIQITRAQTASDLSLARRLFIEYAESLGFDLGFQDFQTELNNLGSIYGAPDGAILLAHAQDKPAGCVALRRFGGDACEMKRLYVRPEFRRLGIGRELSVMIISLAREAGYTRMLLDTLDTMTEAITLYKSLGFVEIESYRHNPLEGATYFELKL